MRRIRTFSLANNELQLTCSGSDYEVVKMTACQAPGRARGSPVIHSLEYGYVFLALNLGLLHPDKCRCMGVTPSPVLLLHPRRRLERSTLS